MRVLRKKESCRLKHGSAKPNPTSAACFVYYSLNCMRRIKTKRKFFLNSNNYYLVEPFLTLSYLMLLSNQAEHPNFFFLRFCCWIVNSFYLMYRREAREPDDLIPPVRNRNLTDITTIFCSQQWHDAIEIAKDRLEEAKEKQNILLC